MSIPKDILADDITNTGRNETLIGNLIAASMISDAIKTSFGPAGFEKMYIDIMGESTITKDGGTFLRKIDVVPYLIYLIFHYDVHVLDFLLCEYESYH